MGFFKELGNFVGTVAGGVVDGAIGVIGDVVHSNNNSDVHYVQPHYVNAYDKADGTHVNGYWRDGDGDTTVNLSENQGGGYMSHNA